MIRTLILLLFVFWSVAVIFRITFGGLIHILLLLAAIGLVFNYLGLKNVNELS